MKLRTYFMTLLLFLLFFNGSILLISSVNLNSNVNSIRERCLGEHYFIATSYANDLKAVESRGTAAGSVIEPLFQSYVSYYGKKNVFLEISKEGQPLYSSLPSGKEFTGGIINPKVGNRVLSTVKLQGKEFISVSGTLPAPYDAYTLTYLYDLSENIASWNRVTRTLYTVGIGLSFLLAVCLILLLNYIFKPLQQISLASQNIARGEYNNRIPVIGRDELSEMAQSFNHMAGEIQNQMVRLAKSAEQKQCFIDNFAHELRTPLTTIYGYAEYIQKAAITEEEKLTATSYIMAQSRRLQNLSYRLLNLAMLRNNEIAFTGVSVPELFRRTAEELSQKAAEKQVRLEYNCQFDSLRGDGELLKCLLVNLADNGVKACNTGGTVKLKACCEDNKRVVIVQDDGRGMTEEQMSHITEAFYRVDKSRSCAEGGAGLGLSLCEQIAACHGAEITFSSQPNQGTTVKIIFTTS
jgi:two-component system OmpR family sensor kinase